jgi:NodT family efflux transporter outer membrane factor (OMF) lipoprotein
MTVAPWNRRLLLLPMFAAILAVVGSCVGGAARRPEIPGADRYNSPGETLEPEARATQQVPTQTIELGGILSPQWWGLFQSAELDSLVKQAVAGSRTLESAKARLVAEQEAVRAARSALFPQVSLDASAAREKQSAAAFGLPSDAFPLPPNYNVFQVGATAAYRVDVFGRTRYGIEQQEALADLQRYQVGAAYLALTGNTVLQALQVAATRAQLEALERILDIDRENLQLVRKERDVGVVPDTDVVRAESQLAADETLLPGLNQQASAASHALAVLLGRAPADWAPPPLRFDAMQLPDRLPVSLPSELAHQRPDILASEAQLHAAAAQVGLATAHLFPDITLSAGISTVGLRVNDLFDPASLVWNVAAGLSQPLFDAGLRRAQRRAALAAFKATAADYQQTVLQAFAQVADLLQALTQDTNLLAAQKRALDTASRSVSLQRVNYERGGTGILDLLDAQRQYDQALLGYVRAKAQRYADTAQLQVALGGGWSNASER